MTDDYETLSGGDVDTEKRLGVFPNPALAECPVVPLGFDGGRVFFAMPEGEIRHEAANKIAGMLKTDIFCCAAGQAFLTYWRTPEDDKFAAQLAAIWFNRKCREAGKWDTRRVQRSLGVWPGALGEVILHKGDEIWRYAPDGTMTAVSIADSLREPRGPLYKLFPPAPRPGEPASASDGAWLRAQFDLWRFDVLGDGEGAGGADVLAGWLMASLLGAVPSFRAHLLIRALAGSGKTTLMELVHSALSALAGDLINSFSDAGFRSDISGMARPVAIDEAESSGGDGGPGPVEQVLNHLRLMATGQGSNRKMGDVGGGTLSQTAVGSVVMAAISPPKMDTALATRVAEIKLLPLNGSDIADPADRPSMATDDAVRGAIRKAGEMAPALLARALNGARRYQADAALLKAAQIEAGESPRTADLIAALAAGRRLLMTDAPLTPEEAAEDVAFWRPLLARRETVEAVSNPGADLLAHLMAWETGMHVNDRRLTVGEIISKWADGDDLKLDAIKALGLRLHAGLGPDGREGPWLIVANHHPGLERITARTQWKDWRSTLEYLDQLGAEHATWATKSLKFGLGIQQRGLAIPLAPWLEKPARRVPPSVPSGVPGEPHEF